MFIPLQRRSSLHLSQFRRTAANVARVRVTAREYDVDVPTTPRYEHGCRLLLRDANHEFHSAREI
jgi:hypothetical protein